MTDVDAVIAEIKTKVDCLLELFANIISLRTMVAMERRRIEVGMNAPEAKEAQ